MSVEKVLGWCQRYVSPGLWLALLLSALLHLLLLREVGWPQWWQEDQSPVALQARLMAPANQTPPRRSTIPSPSTPKPTSAYTPKKQPVPVNPAPIANTTAPIEPAVTEPPAEDPALAEAARQAEIEAWHNDHSLAIDETNEAPPPPYEQVSIDYEMFLNSDFGVLGRASIRYSLPDVDHYHLRWEVEGRGLLKLLYPKLVQESRGEVRPQGLKPSYYRYALGSRADRTHEAMFDWSQRLLTLKTAEHEERYDLAANAQDLLSFMFQFMFVPPLQEMHVVLTNGRRVGEYEYEFEGEETVVVAGQPLQTMHLAHTRGDRNEKVDFWLASEYRNIPVKIRLLNKNGQVIEQIATRIEAR